MNEWSFLFVQNDWMQDVRIKMAAIIKLSENEWVWVRAWCKMAESKMAELNMAEFKITAIIKLSQNE